MTLKEQEQHIRRLQERIVQLVDELHMLQSDTNNFKESVARDLKRAFTLIENK